MTRQPQKSNHIFDFLVKQKVNPNIEFIVTKTEHREFAFSKSETNNYIIKYTDDVADATINFGHKDQIYVTDLILKVKSPKHSNVDTNKVLVRMFQEVWDQHFLLSDCYSKGDTVSFRDIISLDEPTATVKEILLELDDKGGFQGIEDYENLELSKLIEEPEDISTGLFIDEFRLDIFAWPQAVYLLSENEIGLDRWVDLYRICFWLQRSYDLKYILEQDLDSVDSEGKWISFINVAFSIKETPIIVNGSNIEPCYAAAKLGQLWERYKTKYQLNTLSKYDYGTLRQLQEANQNYKDNEKTRIDKENQAIKRYLADNALSGISDLNINEISQKLTAELGEDDYPLYLEIFLNREPHLKAKTIANRIYSLRKDGFFD